MAPLARLTPEELEQKIIELQNDAFIEVCKGRIFRIVELAKPGVTVIENKYYQPKENEVPEDFRYQL